MKCMVCWFLTLLIVLQGYFPMDAPMFGCRSVDKMTGQKDTLSREQFCDGVPQCPDGQDEDIISCFLLQIVSYRFICAYYRIISWNQLIRLMSTSNKKSFWIESESAIMFRLFPSFHFVDGNVSATCCSRDGGEWEDHWIAPGLVTLLLRSVT